LQGEFFYSVILLDHINARIQALLRQRFGIPSGNLINTPNTQNNQITKTAYQPKYKKIALENQLSCDFLANVHYLLYLCSEIVAISVLVCDKTKYK
jgi:hypothetical protein